VKLGRGFTGIFKLDIVHKSSMQNEGEERGERLLDICEVVLHFGRGQAPKEKKTIVRRNNKNLKASLVQEVEKVCYYSIDKGEKMENIFRDLRSVDDSVSNPDSFNPNPDPAF
jgi:hypothetical protein